MKTIYIIRHGKSAHDNIYVSDHNRALLPKGEERTRLIAEYIKKNHFPCQLIISSSAVRAVHTARIITTAFPPLDYEIVVEPRLYNASASEYLDILLELDDSISQVALVGHNPAITEFANNFLKEKLEKMITSAVVCIEINADKWSEIPISPYDKKFIITFKML